VVPSLLQLAMEAVAQWLKASNVCDVLQVGRGEGRRVEGT
jgi:hypothetical protein